MIIKFNKQGFNSCTSTVESVTLSEAKRNMIVRAYTGEILEIIGGTVEVCNLYSELSEKGYVDLTTTHTIIMLYNSEEEYNKDANKNKKMILEDAHKKAENIAFGDFEGADKDTLWGSGMKEV